MNRIFSFKNRTSRQARLAALSLTVALSALVMLALNAQALSWAPAIHLGVGSSPYWDAFLTTRPTDGVVFAVGRSGSGGSGVAQFALEVSNIDTSSGLLCNGNCDDSPNASNSNYKAAGMTFAPNGTGFLYWRYFGSPYYRAWMRIMNPDGSFQPGLDIGANFRNSGGGDYLDYPDVSYSPSDNKLYMIGKLGTASDLNQPGVFATSADNGRTWGEFQTIVDNHSTEGSNVSALTPQAHMCTDGQGNVHTIAYGTGSVYVRSRVNGTWTAPIKMADKTEGGTYGFRRPTNIACGADGYAYATFTADNSSFNVARYTPGSGWLRLTANTVPGANTFEERMYVAPNNTLYMVVGYAKTASSGPSSGSGLAFFTSNNRGQNWSGPETAIPFAGWGTNGVGIAATPNNGGRLYVATQFSDDNGHRDSQYTYAPITVSALPAPTGLTATATSSSQIGLNWTNPGGALGTIHIEHGTDGVNFGEIGTVAQGGTSFTEGGLAYATKYYYRIRYVNGGSTSPYSNVTSTTTLSLGSLLIGGSVNAEPGRGLGTLTISARDTNGNPITNIPGTQITIAKTAGPANSTLSGTLQRPFDAQGNASFTDLALDRIGNYTLTASAGGKSVSTPVSVLGKLVFITGPVSTAVNANQNITVKVVRPSDGSDINNYDGTVLQLAIVPGTGPSDAGVTSVQATTAVVGSASQATFTNVSINRLSAFYQLTASVINGDPVIPAYSNPFAVNATLAVAGPGSTPNAYDFFPVTVTLKDGGNNTLSSYTGTVTLISSGGGTGGVVYGSRTVTATNGTATFNVAVSNSGTAYNFSAALALGGGTTNSVAVTATAQPTTCNNLLVNSNADDNGNIGGNNCVVTLRGAVSRASASNPVLIQPTLTGGQTITVSNALTVTTGLTIDAGYNPTIPPSAIKITGLGQFTLAGNDTLRGMTLLADNKFQINTNNKGNVLSDVRVQHT